MSTEVYFNVFWMRFPSGYPDFALTCIVFPFYRMIGAGHVTMGSNMGTSPCENNSDKKTRPRAKNSKANTNTKSTPPDTNHINNTEVSQNMRKTCQHPHARQSKTRGKQQSNTHYTRTHTEVMDTHWIHTQTKNTHESTKQTIIKTQNHGRTHTRSNTTNGHTSTSTTRTYIKEIHDPPQINTAGHRQPQP